ncbi:MAG: molybdenum cofactor guanylyltransferase [marine benthic group bacterium]|nr:molybdenum cofactor guanylyltransferase [Candidatus Carthagonibacter metallireducens]MCL7964088.1 molybdenum cofactor guanylyltransferase [Gemmatimonadota bacterium]
MAERDEVLGVILAGGANRRFGSHKALARVGGETILERTIGALASAVGRCVIVANEPDPYRDAGLETRPDLMPGFGVLGGILTAVRWAEKEGQEAALVVGCDMPFLSPSLLLRLAQEADAASVVVPASEGPRGFEPLCASYGTETGDAIRRSLDAGERAIVSFFDEVPVRILDFETVRGFGDPASMFLNVNRPEDRDRAERFATRTPGNSPESMDGHHEAI